MPAASTPLQSLPLTVSSRRSASPTCQGTPAPSSGATPSSQLRLVAASARPLRTPNSSSTTTPPVCSVYCPRSATSASIEPLTGSASPAAQPCLRCRPSSPSWPYGAFATAWYSPTGRTCSPRLPGCSRTPTTSAVRSTRLCSAPSPRCESSTDTSERVNVPSQAEGATPTAESCPI